MINIGTHNMSVFSENMENSVVFINLNSNKYNNTYTHYYMAFIYLLIRDASLYMNNDFFKYGKNTKTFSR